MKTTIYLVQSRPITRTTSNWPDGKDVWFTSVFEYSKPSDAKRIAKQGKKDKPHWQYRAIERTVTTTDRVLDAKDGGKG